MEDFISMRYLATCYHCGKDADQVITAVPYTAEVTCDNCGATRNFVPVIQDVSGKSDYVKPGCYDIWDLTCQTKCRHCDVPGTHDVTIGCRNFRVRCRNCGFTHFYRFNLEFIKDKEA